MAQTLTTDLEQIDGAEAADINSAQSADRRYMLPEVVDSGETGTQIADGTLLYFTNNGQGMCELFEYNTGRVFTRIPGYGKLICRAKLAANSMDGQIRWEIVNLRETIIAASDETHAADLDFTDVTTADSAAAISNTDSYSDASYNTGANGAIDTVVANAETEFDAAAAEFETRVNLLIDKFEGQNLSAAA